MAKRDKGKKGGMSGSSWLVTFSDLVTLLLTFFVLILSMSTLDVGIVGDAFTIFQGKVSFLTYQAAGKVEDRFSMVRQVFQEPYWEVLDKQNRIKDLLFPQEVLPPEISRSTLDENLEVLATPEGVALVLSEELLFELGSAELSDRAGGVLDQIARLIPVVSAPVVVSGHTDNIPGGEVSNFELSAQRALSVLDYLLGYELDRRLFSVAGYGPQQPLTPNDTAAGRAKNRRVEILLKTQPFAKTYL